MKSSIQRNIGPFALLLTGLGSIIGSGWLFGAWKAAKIAGPAAICAWIIGAVVILAIALTYAELGAMFPESGGMVRYSHYSHGSLVGFIGAWATGSPSFPSFLWKRKRPFSTWPRGPINGRRTCICICPAAAVN